MCVWIEVTQARDALERQTFGLLDPFSVSFDTKAMMVK